MRFPSWRWPQELKFGPLTGQPLDRGRMVLNAERRRTLRGGQSLGQRRIRFRRRSATRS
jgi:hypothetical protein